MSDSECLGSQAWRPLDARYQRVREMLRKSVRAHGDEDPRTVAVLNFMRRLAGCRTIDDLNQLRAKSPLIYQAFELHQTGPVRLRSMVEARLLGGEPIDSIAAKTALAPAAVECYRDVFYDIEDRRTCSDFIQTQAIGIPGNEASEVELETWLNKVIAYRGGWLALDEVLYPGLRRTGAPAHPEMRTLETVAQGMLDRKAVLAMCCASARDQAWRARIPAMLAQTRKQNEEETGARSVLDQHVLGMLKELPWAAGRDAQRLVPEDQRFLEEMDVELRDDELLRISAGEQLPDELLEELKHLKNGR